MRRLLPILAIALATASLGACGGDDDSAPGSTAATGTTGAGGQGRDREHRGGQPGPPPDAFIDEASGDFVGIRPDSRRGLEAEVELGIELRTAARQAGCELQTDLRDEGNSHLAPGDPAPDYATNPPTSGDHAPVPIADGAYLEPPPETGVVHSLEHGRVAVQYAPDLALADQLELKGLFAADPEGTLLFPNERMPHAVAATAWTHLLACDSYDGAATLAALAAFREAFRGRGPERIPL